MNKNTKEKSGTSQEDLRPPAVRDGSAYIAKTLFWDMVWRKIDLAGSVLSVHWLMRYVFKDSTVGLWYYKQVQSFFKESGIKH